VSVELGVVANCKHSCISVVSLRIVASMSSFDFREGLSCVRVSMVVWKMGQSIFPGNWGFFTRLFEGGDLNSRMISEWSDDRSFILETLRV